jgi:hypothetical protein
MAATEYFGPDHPLTEQTIFSGERVLNYIRQKGLTLAAAPKRRTLKNLA